MFHLCNHDPAILGYSKHKDLVVEFADGPGGRVIEIFEVFLHCSDHGWGPAYQELAVRLPRVGEMFLDNFFSDKANATFPTWRWVVENVKYFETLLVDIHEFLEVIFQQNVFLIYISVDQGNCGTIGWVLEGGTDDLHHRRNTGTARNQAKVTDEVRGIKKIALWSFNTKNVTYLEVSNVARDIAFFICFDNKREMAPIVITTDRGVTPDNDFAINFCGDRNVLTGRQAKYVFRVRELETVNGRVG